MSRDKQIEEMANVIFESSPIPSVWRSDAVRFAEKLYTAGYRKAEDVAREIIQDIVDPVWRAYKDSENEMTTLLAAFICECISTKIKKKYESEGADDEKQ